MQTGLSQYLIRTWENRYGLLEPERTKTNRRLYSEQDLYKLKLIKNAIDTGFKIGELADMDIEELERINKSYTNKLLPDDESRPESVETALNFIRNFDSEGFTDFLEKQSIALSKFTFIMNFIVPLLVAIGKMWEKGDLSISNEHFATANIRNITGKMIEHSKVKNSPVVVSATPVNQYHELMAMMISVILSTKGYRIIYLGPNVPAAEIIRAAKQKHALAAVLSIVYPPDDYSIIEELRKLEQYLEKTDIYIGGSSALPYYEKLSNTSIHYYDDIGEFLTKIEESRIR